MCPDEIIAALAPHLTDARFARMCAVAAERTRYVTALFDRFYDRHNIAACLRTADAFGFQEVHVVAERGLAEDARRPPRDEVLARNVSLNSERWVDRHDHADTLEALALLRQRGYRVVATAMEGVSVDAVPVDAPLVLVFGNEREGLAPEVLAQADVRVTIPMVGMVQSLNVSVAFAILMARLRERCPARLSSEEQRALLARWLVMQVPHAEAILDRWQG